MLVEYRVYFNPIAHNNRSLHEILLLFIKLRAALLNPTIIILGRIITFNWVARQFLGVVDVRCS
jgi:hypothetical protein